jgi:sarcosine oxidase
MGASTTYQLARRGLKTTAIDRYEPPHVLGSTHGITRITREAIGEGEAYVPLARRSHAIWREIEAETEEELLVTCGVLVLSRERTAPVHGKPDFLKQTVATARRFGIPHQVMDAAAVSKNYPQLALAGDEDGYFEPGGGFLYPERCVAAQLRLARAHGAELRLGETVTDIQDLGSHVRVVTNRSAYEAAEAVLAAGAWMSALLGEGWAPVTLYRQVMFWYGVDDETGFHPDQFPAFIWFHGQGAEDYCYGFPALADGYGMKVAAETYRNPLSRPEDLVREVGADEAAAMYDAHVRARFRGVTRECRRARACIYTVAPDSGFVIDRHPGMPRVVVLSPCSGHGFKHSAAIGEAAAQIVSEGRSKLDLSAFALSRFEDAHQSRPFVGADSQ